MNKFAVYIFHIYRQKKVGVGATQKISVNNLTVKVNNKLPPLSWICILKESEYKFFVGNKVEFTNDCLIEGAWDGEFKSYNFSTSEFVFGSGAVIIDNEIQFVPPRHCAESLYVIRRKEDNEFFVSNSINFVLEESKIDIESKLFESLTNAIEDTIELATLNGIDQANPIIFENDEIIFYRIMFYNFSIRRNESIKFHRLSPKRYFRNFKQYREFVKKKTYQVCSNAMSNDRKFVFEPLTSISKGYDSSTTAVIANELGYKKAITLDVEVWNMDDCGAVIGEKLGMDVERIKHIMSDQIENLNIEVSDDLAENSYEFIATVGSGDDITFLVFEPYIKDKIFISGVYGDIVWEKQSKLTSGLPKNGIVGKSTTEFRLRVGYFLLPLPSIGARFSAPIVKLSNSKETEGYSVGGSYDRPIPRKIIEDAGIPRSEFGTNKCATSPNILNRKEIFKTAVNVIRQRYN